MIKVETTTTKHCKACNKRNRYNVTIYIKKPTWIKSEKITLCPSCQTDLISKLKKKETEQLEMIDAIIANRENE